MNTYLAAMGLYAVVKYFIEFWSWAIPKTFNILLDYPVLLFVVAYVISFTTLLILGDIPRLRPMIDTLSRSIWRSTYASSTPYSQIPFVQLYWWAQRLPIDIFALYRRKSTVQYDYKPLEYGNIRLIHLQPGAKGEPLKASIRPISLKQASGTYEAISYAWEGGTKYYDLITEEGIVLITRSLYLALRRLRFKDEIRVLWADAVCINQEDKLEKGKQVGIMSDIYSSGARTLVYLGEASNNSEMALKLLEDIAKADINISMRVETAGPFDFFQSKLPPGGDPAWKALRIFWGRPWFRRVWVIQEFARSLDVLMVCGTWQCDWITFCSATLKCRSFMYASPTIFNVFELMTMDAGSSAMALMADIRRRCIGMTLQPTAQGSGERLDILKHPQSSFQSPGSILWPEALLPGCQRQLNDHRKSSPLFRMGGRFPLLKLLSCCDRSDSTRERDHLFAVLGLSDCAEDESFRPDYTAPFEEVVRRYGKAFVQNGQCMELLYNCRDGSQTYRFPSWIPDWTTKYTALRIDAVRESIGSSNLYRASGDSKSQARVHDIEDSLVVRGGFVDTVIWTGTVPTSDILDIGIPTSLSRVHGNAWPIYLIHEAHAAITSLSSYPTGEPLQEVLWRTLIANKTHTGRKAPDDFGKQLCRLDSIIDSLSESMKLLPPDRARDWFVRNVGESYYNSLLDIFPCYKLAITKNSYFGVVPLLTEVGDRICVLNGGAVPFVLMETKKAKRGYRLMGECYIHGIMNGEVFQKKGWKEEDISIC